MGNIIHSLVVYRYHGFWVFDDEDRDIVREAFVNGTDELIDQLTKNIRHARYGFLLQFSENPWPGQQVHLNRLSSGSIIDGTWYWCEEFHAPGWLCGVLYDYFDDPPDTIYAAAYPIKTPLLRRVGMRVRDALGR